MWSRNKYSGPGGGLYTGPGGGASSGPGGGLYTGPGGGLYTGPGGGLYTGPGGGLYTGPGGGALRCLSTVGGSAVVDAPSIEFCCLQAADKISIKSTVRTKTNFFIS